MRHFCRVSWRRSSRSLGGRRTWRSLKASQVVAGGEWFRRRGEGRKAPGAGLLALVAVILIITGTAIGFIGGLRASLGRETSRQVAWTNSDQGDFYSNVHPFAAPTA